MVAHLEYPFRSLSCDNWLSRGAAGQVFAISEHLVLKCPTRFENGAPSQMEEMVESAEKIANEKAVYTLLMQNPHPNIVHCVFITPDAIFLERAETTLQARLDGNQPTPLYTQLRWIRQIAGALAWLEELGYAHGDLRPANILLKQDHVRLVDFDASVKIGQEVKAASEPYCKLNSDLDLPTAGPASEQFAFASCLYFIRFGHIPFHELEAPTRIQNFITGEYPATHQDEFFGRIILNCWLGKYPSIAAVKQEIESALLSVPHHSELEQDDADGSLGEKECGRLLDDCRAFLANEAASLDRYHRTDVAYSQVESGALTTCTSQQIF